MRRMEIKWSTHLACKSWQCWGTHCQSQSSLSCPRPPHAGHIHRNSDDTHPPSHSLHQGISQCSSRYRKPLIQEGLRWICQCDKIQLPRFRWDLYQPGNGSYQDHAPPCHWRFRHHPWHTRKEAEKDHESMFWSESGRDVPSRLSELVVPVEIWCEISRNKWYTINYLQW